MHRTQVQFTDEQMRVLRSLSAAQKRTVADLVRESVDRYTREVQADRRAAVDRALAVGKFHSGKNDISVNHDDYLAEDFR